MKHLKVILGATCVATVLVAGCASDPYYASPAPVYPSQTQGYPSQGYPSQGYPYPPAQQGNYSYYGVVDRIEVVKQGDANNIAGTIIGGIVGGLIGHQIGSGSGNTAATIAGAAGGAYVGNQAQARSRGPNEAFRVTVRMDDGSFRTVTQQNITDLRTGDRVRVEGDLVYRV
jgi:outer membrane lipoprotein SlyB